MSTPHSPDPLDDTIDELFARQPLKPSAKFTERVLAETEKLASVKARSTPLHPWLRLTLPIAALLIAALVLVQRVFDQPVEPVSPTLSTIELQEIFLLEEELTGLANLADEDLNNIDLLDALTFLDLNTQS